MILYILYKYMSHVRTYIIVTDGWRIRQETHPAGLAPIISPPKPAANIHTYPTGPFVLLNQPDRF